MEIPPVRLFTFLSEGGTAIACKAMNAHYPNVHFEGMDNGCGGWDVHVIPMHGKKIHESTIAMFRNELIQAYEVACVAIRELGGTP